MTIDELNETILPQLDDAIHWHLLNKPSLSHVATLEEYKELHPAGVEAILEELVAIAEGERECIELSHLETYSGKPETYYP